MKDDARRCRSCGRELQVEPRLGRRQQYCSRSRCQRKRRARWQRGRMRTSEEYRAEQLEAQRLARSKNSDYYREYRSGRRRRKPRRNRGGSRSGGGRCETSGPERLTVDGVTGESGPASGAGGRYVLYVVGAREGGATEVVLAPVATTGVPVGAAATMDSIGACKSFIGATNPALPGGAPSCNNGLDGGLESRAGSG